MARGSQSETPDSMPGICSCSTPRLACILLDKPTCRYKLTAAAAVSWFDAEGSPDRTAATLDPMYFIYGALHECTEQSRARYSCEGRERVRLCHLA